MNAKINPTNLVILLFNLVPIAGVAFYNWSPFEMFWLFWMETLIISFFNAIRVFYSQGFEAGGNLTGVKMKHNFYIAFKYLLARMFIFFFYSIFIVVFIGFIAHKEKSPGNVLGTIIFQNRLFNLGLILCVCSQTYFLIRYFFMNGAYFYSKPANYAAIFDGRQIVMHIAVVVGAVGAIFLFKNVQNESYASVWIIAVFCVIKCIFELYFNNQDDLSKNTAY
jgi:hypothetical protein